LKSCAPVEVERSSANAVDIPANASNDTRHVDIADLYRDFLFMCTLLD
jgi:hypothetical protein